MTRVGFQGVYANDIGRGFIFLFIKRKRDNLKKIVLVNVLCSRSIKSYFGKHPVLIYKYPPYVYGSQNEVPMFDTMPS